MTRTTSRSTSTRPPAAGASSTPRSAPRRSVPGRAFQIEICNQQRGLRISKARLLEAARAVLGDEEVVSAEISIAVVDDAQIHQVNRDFLQHDYPTDVISFDLGETAPAPVRRPPAESRRGTGRALVGEVVVSAETAGRLAPRFHWTPQEELLLYLVHGLLHLCGYDDLTLRERRIMRRREVEVLAILGLVPHDEHRA